MSANPIVTYSLIISRFNLTVEEAFVASLLHLKTEDEFSDIKSIAYAMNLSEREMPHVERLISSLKQKKVLVEDEDGLKASYVYRKLYLDCMNAGIMNGEEL